MHEIRILEDGKVQEEYEKNYGKFNDYPPNWKEMTEAEFAQSDFFTYTPEYVEYRQMYRGSDRSEKMVGAHLYHMHDGTGYALVNDYWGEKVKFFRFALCEHNYRELSQKESRERGVDHWGMCYHVYECIKCKRIEAHDSSD